MITSSTDDRPLRVLHLVTDDDRRGAQVFAADLHATLTRRGHDSRVLALTEGRTGGLDIAPVAPRQVPLPTRLRAVGAQLRRAEVAIAHGSRTVASCALVATAVGVPFVARQVSDTRFWTPTVSRRARARFSYRRAERVVALSERAREDLVDHLGLDPATILPIPNGVPVDRFLAEPERGPSGHDRPVVLGYVGALAPEKGVDEVIRAVGRLPGSRLVITGDGPERAALAALAAEVAPGRVELTGSVADPLASYRAMDLLVLPSRGGDSMPAVIIEAGLAGVPSVATAVGSIADVIATGRTGIVVPVDNSRCLHLALERLIADEKLRLRMGRNARNDYATRFDIETVATSYEQCLQRVVHGHR